MSFVQSVANLYRNYSETVVGISDFLRDDLPQNAPGMGKFAQEVGRRACRQYARNRANFGIIAYDPVWSDSCNPYLDSIDEGPTQNGSYEPLHEGGQCAVQYNAFYSTTTYDQFGNVVQVVESGPAPIGPGPLTFERRPDIPISGGGSFRNQTVAIAANGNEVGLSGDRFEAFGLAQSTEGRVARADGQPDDCGNAPGEYAPPGYPPNLPPIPPPTNPGPGFGDNWDVNLNPDGTFEICINGECSDPIPPGPGDSPPGDPSEDPGEEDGDPQENDPNNPQDGDITGCAEDGKILTGIKIEITQTPPSEVPGAGGLYRKVCWVWMGPSQDQLDLVADGRYLEDGQFVIPDANNCRCYKVRPSPLWGLRVQAFSRPEKED